MLLHVSSLVLLECVWLESFESEIQFLKGFKMPSIKIYCLYQIQFFFINNGDFIRVFFFCKVK